MSTLCSVFSQVLKEIPRAQFEEIVAKYGGERHARGFTCYEQFVAMMYCQLGRAHSLREISYGLACCEGKLRHLGLEQAPSKSTISYANNHRPWQIYRDLFFWLQNHWQGQFRPGHKFRFHNKLMSLDSTTIALCVEIFDWAQFQRVKAALKIHLVLDHDGYLPQFVVVTDGKSHDVTVARSMKFEKGTIMVWDKGYADYRWWGELDQEGVYFVTRLRKDAKYQVDGRREIPERHRKRILSDEEITLLGCGQIPGGLKLRKVVVWDEGKQEEFVFITNHMTLAASTIDAIYRERWQIETFFKSLKQLLKVKTFVGTTQKAVLTQIWTAMISMLILRYLKMRSTFGWSLSNLVALLRQQLFVYRDLFQWLNDPFTGPPRPTAEEARPQQEAFQFQGA